MKANSTARKLGPFLSGRGVSPSNRYNLYNLATRFARFVSRECVRRGAFVHPDRVYTTTARYLEQQISQRQLRPNEIEVTLAQRIHEHAIPKAAGIEPEAVQGMVRESGFLPRLFDWAALKGVIPVTHVLEAKRLEASGQVGRAAAFYRAAAEQYESEGGAIVDYMKALSALCRLVPGEKVWHTKLTRERARLEGIVRTVAPEAVVPPQEQTRLWGEIKAIAEAALEKSFPLPEYLSIYARLAGKEDMDKIKQTLYKHFRIDNITPQMQELINVFLQHAEAADITEALGHLDTGPEYSRAFAHHLVHTLKLRETIPQLARIIRSDSSYNHSKAWQAQKTLVEVSGHQDWDLLCRFLDEENSYLTRAAAEAIPLAAKPGSKEDIYRRIRQAQEAVSMRDEKLAAYFGALAKVADHSDVARLRVYLERNDKCAIPAGEIIAAQAQAKDEPLLKEMSEHSYGKVGLAALSALFRLKVPGTMQAAERFLEDCPTYGGGTTMPQIQDVRDVISKYETPKAKRTSTPPNMDRLYQLLWVSASSSDNSRRAAAFVEGVTKEDLAQDRFQIRRMLFAPSTRIAETALKIIKHFRPINCFGLMLEVYKFSLQHRSDEASALAACVLYDLASPEDQAELGHMLTDKENRVKAVAAKIVLKLKAWELIPDVRAAAAEDIAQAKTTVIVFSEHMRNWQTIVGYLTDEDDAILDRSQQALAAIAGPERLPSLREMLGSSDKKLKKAALVALEKLSTPAVHEEEVEGEEVPAAQSQAASSLKLGHSPYTPPTTMPELMDGILTLLDSPQQHVLRNAAQIAEMANLDPSDAQINRLLDRAVKEEYLQVPVLQLVAKTRTGRMELLPKVLTIVSSLRKIHTDSLDAEASFFTRADLKTASQLLQDKRRNVRVFGLSAMAKVGDRRYLRQIEAYFVRRKDEGNWARSVATKACASLASAKDVPHIAEQMFSSKQAARYADVFAEIATAEHAPIIRRMLLHRDVRVRSAGILAATRHRLTEFTPIIAARLSDFLQGTSKTALAFLAEHGTEQDLPLVRRAFISYTIKGSQEAYFGLLTRTGLIEKELPTLLEWSDPSISRYYARRVALSLRILAHIEHPEALPRALAWADRMDSYKNEIAICLEIIGKLGAPENKASSLEKLANSHSSNETYRDSTTRLLVDLWEEGDFARYRDLLAQANRETAIRVYYRTLRLVCPEQALGLAREQISSAIHPAARQIRIASEARNYVMEEALNTVRDLGDEQDLALLFPQLTHSFYRFRDASADAFREIMARRN